MSLSIPNDGVLNEVQFAAPQSMVRLRACLRCRIILPSSQFFQSGCPNCAEASDMQGDRQAVDMNTTKNFTGCVGVVDPRASWVGRHLRIESGVPGMYAIAVQNVEDDMMEDNGDYESEIGSESP